MDYLIQLNPSFDLEENFPQVALVEMLYMPPVTISAVVTDLLEPPLPNKVRNIYVLCTALKTNGHIIITIQNTVLNDSTEPKQYMYDEYNCPKLFNIENISREHRKLFRSNTYVSYNSDTQEFFVVDTKIQD